MDPTRDYFPDTLSSDVKLVTRLQHNNRKLGIGWELTVENGMVNDLIQDIIKDIMVNMKLLAKGFWMVLTPCKKMNLWCTEVGIDSHLASKWICGACKGGDRGL